MVRAMQFMFLILKCCVYDDMEKPMEYTIYAHGSKIYVENLA